ncbi:expressed unknown protein [Seminavis robusta]|uniref:Uncharacterized protein n=1 Tax=Seminavis robusta TaxID=568900 RepID=A0A9N8EBQ9_9STRA|nr:expressed unknown protein [Seminavis robusta]|eukprot:Sro727_g193620.1 n/a (372) ;mRNA; r:30517-31810
MPLPTDSHDIRTTGFVHHGRSCLSIASTISDDIDSSNHRLEANSESFGCNDEEFEDWIRNELCHNNTDQALCRAYPTLFQDLPPRAIGQWRQRYRGNPTLWRRLFKKERVLKEFIEAVPILDWIAWPMQNQQQPKEHHISWEHIYGTVPSSNNNNNNNNTTTTCTNNNTIYQDLWPIPLVTSKQQDLKQSCNHRTLHKRFFSQADGHVLVLAVHLLVWLGHCRSSRPWSYFPTIPIVLPFWRSNRVVCHPTPTRRNLLCGHSFPARLVCANGKFKGKQCSGPPRWHLQHKFETWAEHLFLGVNSSSMEDTTQAARVRVKVQTEGGYQNAFIFAQRTPITDRVWNRLGKNQVASFLSDRNHNHNHNKTLTTI